MKKLAILSSFLLFAPGNAIAQIPEYDGPLHLKGNVKTLTSTGTLRSTVNGKETVSVNTSEYSVDRKGRILNIHTNITGEGMMDGIPGSEYNTVFIYDKKGRIVTKTTTNIGQTIPARMITYTYDKEGREVEQMHRDNHSSEATQMLYKTTYNNQGKIDEIVSIAFNSDGSSKEREKWQYKYDNKDRKSERYYYDYEAQRYWKDESWAYDPSTGKLSEHCQYHTDGSIYTKSVSGYNANGDLVNSSHVCNGKPAPRYREVLDKKDAEGNYCYRATMEGDSSTPMSVTEYIITYYQ